MTRRRELNVFSLSFLDIMSCGFGAVILIFVLINQGSVAEQQTANLDLILTATDLQKRLTEEQARLDELQNITHRASRETRLANHITEQLRNEMTELQTVSMPPCAPAPTNPPWSKNFKLNWRYSNKMRRASYSSWTKLGIREQVSGLSPAMVNDNISPA